MALGILYELHPASTEGKPILIRSAMSMSAAARALCCTEHALKRLMTTWELGGRAAVEQLMWGSGRPCLNKAPKAEIEWLVSPDVLKLQAHMNLRQRAEAFNLQFDRELTANDVSGLYQGAGISKQRYITNLGPPKPTPEKLEASRLKIELARSEIERLKALDYDIFQLDASIFSPDSFIPTAWAPRGHP